ncbi:oxidoreductase [Streptomyces sp. NPDC098101]|uniref:oxidoreductase n=1 Tax=Streptomyces sp. NPDC098101 TaxID=3366096 RepID=UPI003816F650
MLNAAPSAQVPQGRRESPLDPAAVAPIAARLAARVEEERRLTAEIAGALSRAGFARHFVPERWGGGAGTFGHLLDASAELAETCASTAWCATLFAAHGRLAAYLPEEGRRDLWGASPDVRVAAAVVPPSGSAVAVDHGWRLDGSWGYASGVAHADWVLLGSWTPGAVEGTRDHRVFAVPRADVEVRHTWRSLGLRGTGSDTVAVDGVFVPAHRSFTVADLAAPLPGAARCHGVPYPMVAALMFAAPALGAARAARSAWIARVPGSSPRRLRAFAAASSEIHAAGLLLADVARRADGAEPVTPLAAAECRRDATAAAALCARAVDGLFRAAGAGGLMDDHPLRRPWQDVLAVTAHAALDPEAAAEDYARLALGSPA